jgi:type I restriction enzyme S subunit
MKQGWEIKKLGDLCNLMTGGTPSRSKPEYFIDGKIKWLVSGDIHSKYSFKPVRKNYRTRLFGDNYLVRFDDNYLVRLTDM